jgi:hypothetical protein
LGSLKGGEKEWSAELVCYPHPENFCVKRENSVYRIPVGQLHLVEIIFILNGTPSFLRVRTNKIVTRGILKESKGELPLPFIIEVVGASRLGCLNARISPTVLSL